MAKQPLDLPTEADSIKCGSIRLSKRGVWRAAVLILVHVVFILHFIHWKTAGRTVTPVEPSESMQTLELGYVNAGIILFIILILSTLIFGRFFCGWGCHVVALQDLCGWLLKKLGMKPKAFRSRLLVYVPLFAAFYMFVLPTITRLLERRDFPGLSNHLMTDDFWATFPTPGIAVFTFLVCGFLIVWLVGNKGFCTYGCPYGAFFFYADKAAPGKIRVTDDCEQCGHCTASCTSNVRVHEEVARFGMVVDAGCMKCLDCISVCPKNALYYGFGRTSLRVKSSEPAKQPRKYDFSWPEEIAMALVFIGSLYAYRELYGAVPFLLSLGLSAITAFLAVAVARLFYQPNVRWQRLQLRLNNSLTPTGFGAILFGALLFAFLCHSAIWTFNYHEGNRLSKVALAQAEHRPDEAAAAAASALERYQWCSENGFFQVSTVEAGIGSSLAFNGDLAEGEVHLAKAVKLGPELQNAWVQLGRTQAAQGKLAEARKTFEMALEANEDNAEAAHQLGLLVAVDSPEEALQHFERALKVSPADSAILVDYGVALAQAGRSSEGADQLELALSKGADKAIRFNLAVMYAELGRLDDARSAFGKVLEDDPDHHPATVAMARLELQERNLELAREYADKSLEQSPFDLQALDLWVEILVQTKQLDAEIAKLIRARPDDEASWYKAAMLYRRKGEDATAKALFQRLLVRNPNLPRPGG